MLPTGGFDYLTQKTFEDPLVAARQAERRALMYEFRIGLQRRNPLGRALKRLFTFLGGSTSNNGSAASCQENTAAMLASPAPENDLKVPDSTSAAVSYGLGVRWSMGVVLAAALSSFLALVIVVVLGCAQSTPNSARTFGFDRCDQTLCFRGLVPGLTSWKAAQEVLGGRVRIIFEPPDGEIHIFPTPDGKLLGRIRIRLPDDGSLSAGMIVGLYGPPCGVTLHPQSAKFILHYPTVRFVTPPRRNALRLYTPLVGVEFSPSSGQKNTGEMPCVEHPAASDREVIARPWFGFTTAQQYLARRP